MTAEQLGAFRVPTHLPFRPSPQSLVAPGLWGTQFGHRGAAGQKVLTLLLQEDARGRVI